MKKVLSIITCFSIIMTLFTTVTVCAEVLASDEGYGRLDLSLTETIYDSIGQQGKIIAAVVNEKTVNMYKNPVYGSYNTASVAYYAVKVDADTKDFVREGEKEDILRPQRTVITDGLTYSVDNNSVISLNPDGSFVTTGYGIANITVTYDSGTPDDTNDDAVNSVTVICSDDHRMSVGQEFWTNPSSQNSFMRLHEFVDGTWKNDGGDYRWGKDRSTAAKAHQGFRLNWDPMGDSDGPLVIEAFAEKTGLLTPATTHEMRDGGYIKNSPVIMHTWFYDSMNLNTTAHFVAFGYSGMGTQGQKSFELYGFNNENNTVNAYRLAGGDYTTRNGSAYFTNKSKDTSSSTGIKPEDNPSGVINALERTKGWHQFVVTAEPSIIMPGTDYLLTKAYLDGKLITAQDIYVGDIPADERQCNLRVYDSKSSSGITDTDNTFNKALTCYKGIYVAGYKNSKNITDSIPSDGATNVPLYHPVRIKLGTPVNSLEDVNISFKKGSTDLDYSARLDETKTVVTIDAGKFDVKETYFVTVNGDTVSFTTGENTEIASVIEAIETDAYKLSTARYIDFADKTKAIEEYGVGLSFNTMASELSASGGILTLKEGVRTKEFTATTASSNYFNALLVRNLTEHNNEDERIIISYKAKFDGIGSTQKNRGHAAGFSVPVLSKDNPKDAYNPTLRKWMPSKSGSNENGRPYIETESAAGYTVRHLLVANNKEGVTGSKGQTEGTSAATQSQFSIGQTAGMRLENQIDEDGYIRFTYVVDVDPKGEKNTTWRYVIGDDLNFLNRIFAAYECGGDNSYTGVDSLYIPLTNVNYGVQEKNVSTLSIKDIQVYTMSKTFDATVGDTITVKKSGTDETVYSDNLRNVTVDASVMASGEGSYTAIFAIVDGENNMIHTVKTVTGDFTESESEIKAEGIVVPDEDNLKLYAYVWTALDDTVIIKTKINYDAVSTAE